MKTIIILLIILLFLLTGYFTDRLVRKYFRPKESFLGFIGYMFTMLLLVFVLTFLMVLLIAGIYPAELIK